MASDSIQYLSDYLATQSFIRAATEVHREEVTIGGALEGDLVHPVNAPASLNVYRLPVEAVLMREQRALSFAQVANGQTISDTIDGRGYASFGVAIPAAFTGTAISFHVSADGLTFQQLYTMANAVVSVPVNVGRSYDLPGEVVTWPYWRIVSNAAEAALRSIAVVGRG